MCLLFPDRNYHMLFPGITAQDSFLFLNWLRVLPLGIAGSSPCKYG